MSGVGAEMPEQPPSRMTAVTVKATIREGEPARSEAAWNCKVTGTVPREDGVVHAQSVSVSWVRGMPRIYHTGAGYRLLAISYRLLAISSGRLRPLAASQQPTTKSQLPTANDP
jgi:hypothetical protein